MLFVVQYKVGLTFDSVDEILKCDHSNESCWEAVNCVTVLFCLQSEIHSC